MIEWPRFSPSTTFFILFGILIIRYFMLAGVFSLIIKSLVKGQKIIPLAEGSSIGSIKNDVTWSILSSSIFALMGVFLIELWHEGFIQIILGFELRDLVLGLAQLIGLMILHDTYFYWTHRLLHTNSLFQFHRAHHISRNPSAWTSFSFHPIEAILQSVIIPVLFIMMPVYGWVLISFLTIMSITGVTNHLGYEVFTSPVRNKFFPFLITATHHQKHHHNFNKNFALYFNFWDNWMGTEHGK